MKYSVIIFALVCILFVSCKEKAMKGLPVPSDAMSVIHVNGSSINSKASWKEIGVSGWLGNKRNLTTDSTAKILMDDPEKSGIDIKSDFIHFTRNKSNIAYMVLEGFIKDAGAFEDFSKKIHPGGNIKDDDDFKFLTIDNDKLLSWNNSKFIFISGAVVSNPGMNRNYVQENATVATDSLISYANTLFHLTEGLSLEKNNVYTALLKESGDIHIWTNTALSVSSMGGGPFALLSASPLMQDNYSTTTVNFENGKILSTSKFHFGEALSKVMAKHEVPNLTKDAFNRIPSKDVACVFAWNFNPETIREFFTAAGINPDNYLKEYNTSLDQIVKSTNGQILFSLIPSTENKSAPDPANQFSTIPMPFDLNALFAISVRDKTSVDQFMTFFKNLLTRSESTSKITIPYKLNDQWLAIGTSTKQVDSFMLGGNYSHAFADRISGDPMGGYIDINKLIAAISSEKGDSSKTLLAKNTWEDVIIKGGRYKDRSMSVNAEINFVDKSTNSLKQIGKFISDMRMLEDQKSESANKTASIY